MKILLVIVTYNGSKWIEACINSVFDGSLVPDVFIVDNNGSDNTVDVIKEKFKDRVTLVESEKNLGFGKANNIGFTYALENNYDFVFLLNQDAFLEFNTLERLVEVSIKNNEFGILSPIQLNGDGTKLEWYFAEFVNVKNNDTFYADFVIGKKQEEVYNFKFINAAAWLLPIKTLKLIGGFDPIFWHYGEDNNYCQRVLFHNLKIGVVSSCYVKHDSNIRNYSNEYIYSDRYFQDFVKDLQIKYANLNYNLNFNVLLYERKKIIKKIFLALLYFDFKEVSALIKKNNLLIKTIQDIKKSRNINKELGPHYI